MPVESLETRECQRLPAPFSEIATLAGGLAHEIKNHLSTMSLHLELMGEELHCGESPRDHRLLQRVHSVQRECRHLEEILNAFLQYACVGELDLGDADLNQLLHEFIDFYQPHAQEHGIEISPHLAPDLPPVCIDRSLIRQVLMNLTLNAQQAMPRGGILELQTRARGGRVELDLIDNGAGMDARTREKIFDVFLSTKPEGSGLGLPTVRRIVEAHGGTIACESEPGSGTRFTVSLPVCAGNEWSVNSGIVGERGGVSPPVGGTLNAESRHELTG
jgi:signal transduction histidine kinase